ncbi:terminase family protein [uncultured Maritalea sp.]|uniref:DNA-packaging protein n=1 Tax=uncultured Maritalea sp. TaxID=757249 RepID=UPI00261DE779|nr:terminase family protein [uncultured Maritalea sp.]
MRRVEQLLSQLSQVELEALQFDWTIWARQSQLPPKGDWTTWLLLGGRGAGKTRAGAEWVRANATGAVPKSPIALIGETISDARAVMVEGHSGLMSIHPSADRPVFNRTRNEVEWSNGAIARLYSASDPESLRGPQFASAWCDETCKWPNADDAWDMLQFCLRIGERPQQLVTTTPKPIKLLKRIIDDPMTCVTKVKTAENRHNLAPSFLNSIVNQYRGTSLGRQELEGEILQSNEDALWSRQLIDLSRAQVAPELERIVIAVDPPVSSNAKSDKCGIVVAGLLEECVYVLADATIARASPLKWANRVAELYDHFEADCVVAEVNQGGDLVANALHQVNPNLPVKNVHAKRGKWLRAEPVALLYERGSVRHVGMFSELEDEMCNFAATGKANGHSPDRLDALVWAVTELALVRANRPRIRNI